MDQVRIEVAAHGLKKYAVLQTVERVCDDRDTGARYILALRILIHVATCDVFLCVVVVARSLEPRRYRQNFPVRIVKSNRESSYGAELRVSYQLLLVLLYRSAYSILRSSC